MRKVSNSKFMIGAPTADRQRVRRTGHLTRKTGRCDQENLEAVTYGMLRFMKSSRSAASDRMRCTRCDVRLLHLKVSRQLRARFTFRLDKSQPNTSSRRQWLSRRAMARQGLRPLRTAGLRANDTSLCGLVKHLGAPCYLGAAPSFTLAQRIEPTSACSPIKACANGCVARPSACAMLAGSARRCLSRHGQ